MGDRLRPVTPCVLAMLCQAACFSDRGLAVEVDVGDTGATSVELFLGATACDPGRNAAGIDCTSIGPPPSGSPPLPGPVWFRDSDARIVAAVSGHTATFQLQADPGTTLPIVIAVGSTTADGLHPVGTATLRDLSLPTSSARIVMATLTGATAMDAASPAGATGDRVLVWTKAMPPSACLAVEHRTTSPPTYDLVVPADDPDCDDVAQECNPAAYLGSENLGNSEVPNCAELAGGSGPGPGGPGPGGTCTLGLLECVDGQPPSGTCTAPPDGEVCVPSQVCQCSQGLLACMRDRLDGSDATAPFISCTVPVRELPGGLALCSNKQATTLLLDDVTGNQDSCGAVAIGGFQLTQFAADHSFDGLDIALAAAGSACHIAVIASGTPSNDETRFGVVELSGSSSRALVPIVLNLKRDVCGLGGIQFSCVAVGVKDAVWGCGLTH